MRAAPLRPWPQVKRKFFDIFCLQRGQVRENRFLSGSGAEFLSHKSVTNEPSKIDFIEISRAKIL